MTQGQQTEAVLTTIVTTNKTHKDDTLAKRKHRRELLLAEREQARELLDRVYPRAAARRRGQRRLATYRL